VRIRDDRGASVIDFVLVSTLLVLLLFGVLQVAVYVYARNVVSAAAAEGARNAAELGSDPMVGQQRADEVIAHALPGAAQRVHCTGSIGIDAASGLTVTTVRCRGTMRAIFLPLRMPWSIDVSSSVLRETPP
jgi:Flp pilus assembly protein TadG